jgi:iron complex transport system substrate-binding protein
MATPQRQRHFIATNATDRYERDEQPMDIEETASAIVDVAFKLHRHLGPGPLESAYETLMGKELERRGLQVERQKPVALEFDGIRVEDAFRVNLLVNGKIVVELKASACCRCT